MHRLVLMSLLILCSGVMAEFPSPIDTQNPNDKPPTPAESTAKITVPEGFVVTLFAGDPDVRQPIDMTTDDRGRLWVTECYTFAGRGFDRNQTDRILIFQDTDQDGRFDQRKVFWDRGHMLTSAVWGFEGVFALNDGKLIHFPDADRDDVPDGEPTALVDGFTHEAQHNVVNGLMWGPDGWLYGRHGILATSKPGVVGTPDAEREPLNCGIWRYHPTRKVFEIIARGTTNPWGSDFNEQGELFFTNNVTGHAWHVVPGSHYKRMYGEDFNPYLYELMDQSADHYHWDTGKKWSDSRSATGLTDKLGGGHSHCGGLIYQGDNWPAEYRGRLLLCNTHGRRVNRDRIERSGTGYTLKHEADFMSANQPWFRGVSLVMGPDGGVYVSDWSDFGECHDHDGVHRSSGRIYKIVYKQPKKVPADLDLSKLDGAALARLQSHDNDWYARHARRLLQERAAAGDVKDSNLTLSSMLAIEGDTRSRLRALWTLEITGQLTDEERLELLDDGDEHVRTWALRLLVEGSRMPEAAPARLADIASRDTSGLVRAHLAGAAQRLKAEQAWPILSALAGRVEDAKDEHQALLVWYGLEPHVLTYADRAVALAMSTTMAPVRQLIARRLAVEIKVLPAPVDALVRGLAKQPDETRQDVLTGMTQAFHGWPKAPALPAWTETASVLSTSKLEPVRTMTRDLSVLFGDGRALDELRRIVEDGNAEPAARRAALRVVIDAKPNDLGPLLLKLVDDRATDGVAAAGLATLDLEQTPKKLLGRYGRFDAEARQAAIGTLASRSTYAKALLDAVGAGQIDKRDISAFHARQMLNLGDAAIEKQLTELWGTAKPTTAEKRKQIEAYKHALTDARLAEADRSNGRAIYARTCLACHRLYGEGGTIGPDLTGAGRDNIDYLLDNIVDPSGVVADQFKLSVIRLKGGRVISGTIVSRDANITVVQTASERQSLPTEQVEDVQTLPISLMPEGQLQTLSADEVRDLIGYLMFKAQVPLPGADR